jgi:hypothetical protein
VRTKVFTSAQSRYLGLFGDSFAGGSETEVLEWHLFVKFLSFDRSAGRPGGEPERVAEHVEYLLQKNFQNVAEWLGEEGDKWRKQCGISPVSDQFKTDWAAFLSEHRERSLADVEKEIATLQLQFEQELAGGRLQCDKAKPKRRLPRQLRRRGNS